MYKCIVEEILNLNVLKRESAHEYKPLKVTFYMTFKYFPLIDGIYAPKLVNIDKLKLVLSALEESIISYIVKK